MKNLNDFKIELNLICNIKYLSDSKNDIGEDILKKELIPRD